MKPEDITAERVVALATRFGAKIVDDDFFYSIGGERLVGCALGLEAADRAEWRRGELYARSSEEVADVLGVPYVHVWDFSDGFSGLDRPVSAHGGLHGDAPTAAAWRWFRRGRDIRIDLIEKGVM